MYTIDSSWINIMMFLNFIHCMHSLHNNIGRVTKSVMCLYHYSLVQCFNFSSSQETHSYGGLSVFCVNDEENVPLLNFFPLIFYVLCNKYTTYSSHCTIKYKIHCIVLFYLLLWICNDSQWHLTRCQYNIMLLISWQNLSPLHSKYY